MEKIIHKKSTEHLIRNKLITSCQPGFIAKRPTLTQQLCYFEHLTKFQDNKQNCEAIYLDFTKAFDKISHRKLILVLSHFKFNKTIITWIHDFLQDRTQQTVVEGSYSSTRKVTSGVPQGSVLAPLYFVLYLESLIKDLQEHCQNIQIFAFADDVKLLGQDQLEIKKALQIIEKWCENWNLCLQPKKSEHLSFVFSKSTNSNPLNFYISNSLIPKTNFVKDLGLTLSTNLKWAPYISKTTAKANVMSYNIIRSFVSTNLSLYTGLYKTFIRPLLEYNTPIWNPDLITDIKSVEHIQRKFTRMVCQKSNTSFTNYQDRLKIMHLDTLEIRRVRFDLILMYKIYHNIIDIDFNSHFKLNIANKNYSLRGHNFKLQRNKYSTARNRYFCERVIPTWNKLPVDVVEALNVEEFKTKLTKFDLNKIYTSKI